MQAYAPRPSEASIKIYERSESILAFAFEITKSICKKTAPKPSETRSKNTSFSEYIGAVLVFFLLIVLNLFKSFLAPTMPRPARLSKDIYGGIDAHIWRD